MSGVDLLLDLLPRSFAAIKVAENGSVSVSHEFRHLEQAWNLGLAAMAGSGAGLIIDEVFLSGGASQQRLAAALGSVPTVWVGVHCRPDVASAREAQRTDRVLGMAMSQATAVHRNVDYDIEIDTSDASPIDCARRVLQRITQSP